MKNIWPVKTACCDTILYFIAYQTVFCFVLHKTMTIFCKHAAIKISHTPEYKIKCQVQFVNKMLAELA